jgi:membrane-associated phospholipid phosphatase
MNEPALPSPNRSPVQVGAGASAASPTVTAPTPAVFGASFAVCALAVVLCYFYVDRPVAYWIDAEAFRRWHIFEHFTRIAEACVWFSALYYVVYALTWRLRLPRPLDWRTDRWLAVANSVVCAGFLKDTAKFLFGRTWPATWVNGNPSLLRDGVFGFHLFHAGPWYQSFPSGHACVAVAAMTAVWLLFPRWRLPAVLAAALVVLGLLANDYHFVSDCVAGAWLGAMVAWYVCALPSRRAGRVAVD